MKQFVQLCLNFQPLTIWTFWPKEPKNSSFTNSFLVHYPQPKFFSNKAQKIYWPWNWCAHTFHRHNLQVICSGCAISVTFCDLQQSNLLKSPETGQPFALFVEGWCLGLGCLVNVVSCFASRGLFVFPGSPESANMRLTLKFLIKSFVVIALLLFLLPLLLNHLDSKEQQNKAKVDFTLFVLQATISRHNANYVSFEHFISLCQSASIFLSLTVCCFENCPPQDTFLKSWQSTHTHLHTFMHSSRGMVQTGADLIECLCQSQKLLAFSPNCCQSLR